MFLTSDLGLYIYGIIIDVSQVEDIGCVRIWERFFFC